MRPVYSPLLPTPCTFHLLQGRTDGTLCNTAGLSVCLSVFVHVSVSPPPPPPLPHLCPPHPPCLSLPRSLSASLVFAKRRERGRGGGGGGGGVHVHAVQLDVVWPCTCVLSQAELAELSPAPQATAPTVSASAPGPPTTLTAHPVHTAPCTARSTRPAKI